MKYIKFLLVPMLFVSLAFMNVGGCGGSGNGGGNQPTNPPPTNVPPTDPPPTNPPPTDPPPTNPPPTDPPPTGTCQMPSLETDFSNELYLFIDSVQGIGMGVTSTGEETITVLVDTFGTVVTAIADVISPFACVIEAALINDLLFNATGICGRSDDATLFLVADFFVGTVEIIEITIGECESVEPIPSTSEADIAAAIREFQSEIAINGFQEPMDFSGDFGNAFEAFEDNGLIE